MLLSAALIVRDEEENLPGCLRSIAGVVDEVVVVDTGSTDATVALARAAGATVTSRPWDGRFDAARNAALDLAAGDWILYIDADERLTADEGLRHRLATTDAVAGLVQFRTGTTYTCYREYRLFRNRPDIRFRGVIHETIVPDIKQLIATEGATVIDVPAHIDHFGYEGDQSVKHHRNLPLLQRQVVADPTRVYLWFHLGSVHEGLGDAAAADAAWAQGVEVARARAAPSPLDVLVYAKLALRRLHDGRDASDLVADLRAHFPDDPFTAWVAAHQAMAAGRWADAVPFLEGLTDLEEATLRHTTLAYDRRLFEELPAHCLGLCAFHLGDDEGAARWFGRAAVAAPDVEEYRLKQRLAVARAGR